MKRFSLIVLLALSLGATSVLSLFASSPELAAQRAAHSTVSPLSPLPAPSDSDSDNPDPWLQDGPVASGVVWQPQATLDQMWIKTHQVGVGWWDAAGQLHIALQVNGVVKIPLPDAVMISIPWDAAGVLAPPGWQKFKRPENGEWVIVPTN